MLDAPYSELLEADVGLRYMVLRWQCSAACQVSWGAADEVLRLLQTCITERCEAAIAQAATHEQHALSTI